MLAEWCVSVIYQQGGKSTKTSEFKYYYCMFTYIEVKSQVRELQLQYVAQWGSQ